jgi:hypothetical protein
MKTRDRKFDPELFVTPLSLWMGEEYKSFFRTSSLGREARQSLLKRSLKFLESNRRNPHFKALVIANQAVAVVTLSRHPNPRIRHQHLIDFYYAPLQRKVALRWIKRELAHILPNAPAGTVINVPPADESFLGKMIERSGFTTRYELLVGETSKALRELVKKRNPPENLDHLGLKIRVLKNTKDLDAAMRLQKRVSWKSKQHTYYSHTKSQMKIDRETYREVLKKKSGLILGVYRAEKMVGLMMTTISIRATGRLAGFSFFFDESIQGKGITSTGYRILLSFLKKRNVPLFIGGTSQPAIKILGKLMMRRLAAVSYVKMNL